MEHAAPDAQYSTRYRNPCWEHGTGVLRCIPFAYILGGFHSGVTSLATKVSRHPSIATDASSNAQFWAEDGKKMAEFILGFQSASQAVQHDPHKIILEASQSTLAFYAAAGGKAHRHFAAAMSPCWRDCSDVAVRGEAETHEQCVAVRCFPAAKAADRKVAQDRGFDFLRDQNVPLLMRAVYGDKLPRLIAVIRNPIDRLHSAYFGYPHYHSKHGRNPTGFLAYVKEQVAAFRECQHAHGGDGTTAAGDACVLLFEQLDVPQEQVYYHCDQLLRGMYSVYLERWLAVFPRSHLLVLKAEDVFKDVKAALTQIFSFLEVGQPDDTVWETMRFAGPIQSYAKEFLMLPEARQLLLDLYKPYNVRLSTLLGDPSLLEWNKQGLQQ